MFKRNEKYKQQNNRFKRYIYSTKLNTVTNIS